MRKVGIFGGTFNPPHLGHMILAAEAADQLELDMVYWMPAPLPPHKQGQEILPFEKRVEMVNACIQGEPKFQICLIESERPGPHYSSDTLAILKEKMPGDELFFLIGGDSLQNLPTWHEPQKVLDEIYKLGVMHRPDEDIDYSSLERDFPNIREKIALINAPLLEISSTEIRTRAASGHHYRYYVEEAVYQIIREKGYYQVNG